VAGERRGFPALPGLVAWLVWLVLGAVAFAAAAHAGPNVPMGEDWRMVPAVTGHEPEPVHWLWHQDGNDRHPVGRALTLATISITRDFRAPAVLAVSALVLLSALLLRAAHRVRGRPRWSDAFFPVILLQPAPGAGLPPSALLFATVPLMLGGVILLAVLSDPALRTRRWSVLTALAMVTLPLTGLAGILVAAAAAPWVAACGWRHWPPRDPGVPVDAGPALLSFIFVAVVVTGMVFSDYDFSGWSDPALDRGLLLFRTGSALAAAFGPAAASHWQLVALVLVGLVLVTSVLLLVTGYRLHDIERYRLLGLACMLAAAGLAVMMSAWQFAALLLCVVYCVWELYGSPAVSVALEAGLLVAALAVLPANFQRAAAARQETLARVGALERDITAGVPRAELVERHGAWLMPEGTADELSAGLEMVAGTGMGPLGRVMARPGN
jgi:uncharacterized membrane protein YhaH (DUF805 family)